MSKCKAIKGYTKLPNSVLMDTRLSGDARWLYVVLRSYTRPGKGECWPGQERLAKVAGWGTRTGQWDRWRVQRALDELEDAYLIRRERRGGGRTNCYTLLPAPEEFLITDDSEVTAPTVMRKRRGRTQRKSASQQCASDAHRSEADPQHEMGGILRNSAQHEIADQDGSSPQFLAPSCAQRSSSSLRGRGSSSDVDCDVGGVVCEDSNVDVQKNDAREILEPFIQAEPTDDDFEIPPELIEAGIAWAQEPVDRVLVTAYKLGLVRIIQGGKILCANGAG